MKILIIFLPLVICFDNFYIVNKKDLLVCGNKSAQVNNVNWYEAENGVFKNMSIALKKYQLKLALRFITADMKTILPKMFFFQQLIYLSSTVWHQLPRKKKTCTNSMKQLRKL